MEKHESDIEKWYFKHQDVPLNKYLCVERALKKGDDGCLYEEITAENKESEGDNVNESENKKSEL